MRKYIQYFNTFGWLSKRDTYHPDIDGLRALAVAVVVWFHAFPTKLPGGFVGVDIFFVISGFLISTILLREFEAKSFSYSRFMARRIRRIFPGLVCVLLASWLGGWWLLTDKEFLALGREIVAGSLFFANVLFWQQDGYFDTASEFKPLLHLWSLGLEEQFYIVYPPLLWAALTLRKHSRVWCVLGGTLMASFGLGLLALKSQPAFAFFMLPARFWELMSGGMVAYFLAQRSAVDAHGRRLTLLKNLSALLGSVLIILAICLTRKDNFPGIWAVLPTAGTCLFILAGPEALINRWIFSFRPIVGIGLISYPLYLWHWPLLSFEYILASGRPDTSYVKIALWIALGLSILTYFLIEKPFRHVSISNTYKWIAPLSLVTTGLGGIVLFGAGFPRRIAASDLIVNQGEIDHVAFHKYGDDHFLPCADPGLRNNALTYQGTLRCHQSRPGVDYDLILLGDSHAEQLFYGLASVLPNQNIVYATNFGLPTAQNSALKNVYDSLLKKPPTKITKVILGGAWSLHLHEASSIEGTKIVIEQLQKRGYKVFLTDDLPVFSFEPSLCKYQRRLNLRKQKCHEKSQEIIAAQQRIQQDLASLVSQTGASLLRTHDFFKDEQGYFMAHSGNMLYRDFNHLNISGSLYLGKKLASSGQLELLSNK